MQEPLSAATGVGIADGIGSYKTENSGQITGWNK